MFCWVTGEALISGSILSHTKLLFFNIIKITPLQFDWLIVMHNEKTRLLNKNLNGVTFLQMNSSYINMCVYLIYVIVIDSFILHFENRI